VLRLKTFGALSLEGGAPGPGGRSGQRRRLALLALLAAHRHRAVSREKLLLYFWPERAPEEARHSLAQLAYGIRQDLGDEVLQSGPDDLRTNPAVLSADVADFEAAIDRGDLQTAVALYAGPFLDGFFLSDALEFERWIEDSRAHLARRYALALESLARAASRSGSATEAVEAWRRRAALEPLDAGVAMELMKALAAAGDRPGAFRHAAVHATLLRAEFNAPADLAVEALAERMHQELGTAPIAPAPHGAPLPLLPAARRWWRKPVVTVAAGAILIALLAGLAVRARAGRVASVGGARLVVLGVIEGPDTTLTLAVREALRSGLEEEPGIRVLGETRIREILRLMARPADLRLTGSLASEVALRGGAAFAVVGSVVPIGTGLQIVAEALDPRTGEAILTVSEHPATADRAVAAIARVGERLRQEALGVSRGARLPALPRVMTSSLEALQDYALARLALARFDRPAALRFAEAALEQDSLFPMAHYVVADLDWFGDHQRDCEFHLSRALALTDRLPPKERLLVRARYEQLVADHSDSALVYWERLRAAFPDDGQAFEGMAWTYRAMGRFKEAAAAADSAIQLDSTTFAPSATNELYALIEAGDTTAALRYARSLHSSLPWLEVQARYQIALRARDWRRALQAFPDTTPSSAGRPKLAVDPYHHLALLLSGRVAEAAQIVPVVRRNWPAHQFAPRAIWAQARVELARGGSRRAASAAAREVLAWIEAGDLSAPAIARLTERTVELAARAGDGLTIQLARRLLERRDRGRDLPSFRLALLTVDAAAAFVRGDMRTAAHFAEAARQGMFHGRSLALAALLEADARAALGQTERAAALYRQLLTPDAFAAGDLETWALVVGDAARGLERLRVGAGRTTD
jgi:DNA-binding SARP family transcriptional activator/tetratricopeptide (TPR) repeat protein